MDVFQDLLLPKRKTQEDEIIDILFKRRKSSNYHMEQATTSVACAASGLLRTNTRKPSSADKPWDSDGGSKAIVILENTSLLADFFNTSLSDETANVFRHRLRFL